jgi:hypothetical protein
MATSASGTSRHFGSAQLLGRFRNDADINRQEPTPSLCNKRSPDEGWESANRAPRCTIQVRPFGLTALVALPTLLTVFTICASVEIAGRLRGGRGLFGWIAGTSPGRWPPTSR